MYTNIPATMLLFCEALTPEVTFCGSSLSFSVGWHFSVFPYFYISIILYRGRAGLIYVFRI